MDNEEGRVYAEKQKGVFQVEVHSPEFVENTKHEKPNRKDDEAAAF